MKLLRTVLICGALALVALVATGCGSSSGSGSTSAQASASTTAGGGNRQQIADCLKKQGITLPQRRPGNGPGNGNGSNGGGGGGGFFFGGGGNGPPSGAANGRFAKIQAALKKCGINPQRNFRNGGGFQANSARFRTALTKFVACVRKNGYDLPKANTSGKGPVFDASKINRNDPKFKAAVQKCQSTLQALRPQGGGGAPPTAPPANQ